jgi:NADH-quinone oxidoreductase subunit G
VCPSCSNGCNITIHHYREQIWRMMPRRNDAVNDTWMCDHGRLNYRFVNDTERLRAPMKRRGASLEACTWDEAILAAAGLLRDAVQAHGPNAAGVIASPHFTNEESFRLAQLVRFLGIPNVDIALEIGQSDQLLIKAEKAANSTGARDMGLQPAAGGLDLPGMLAAAAEGKLRLLYVCGSDLAKVADPALLERALAKVDLIVHDLFRSPLAERARVVLPSLSWAEKTGTFTNIKRRVQQIHRAVTPPNEQPSDGQLLSQLLGALREGPLGFEPTAVLEEIAATVPAYAGISFAQVGAQGYALAPAAGATA